MSPRSALIVINAHEFRVALLWSLAGLAVVTGFAMLTREQRARPAPLVGLAIATCGAAAIASTRELPAGLVLGLLSLAAAGIVADIMHAPVIVGAALAVPGALVVSGAGPTTPSWAPNFVALTVVAGGACVASFDTRHGDRGLGPILFSVSALGLYACVPDTEEALVLVGVTLPFVAAGWPWPLARLGTGGAYAATGLFIWTAAVGGAARPASIVGAVACLGLLVAEPVGRMIGRPWWSGAARSSPIDRLPDTARSAAVIGVIQIGIVLLTARTAGVRASVSASAKISVVVLGISVAVCVLMRPADTRAASGRIWRGWTDHS